MFDCLYHLYGCAEVRSVWERDVVPGETERKTSLVFSHKIIKFTRIFRRREICTGLGKRGKSVCPS